MPTYDLFGNLEYSKEELKQMEQEKKQAEKAEKEALEQEKKAKKEFSVNISKKVKELEKLQNNEEFELEDLETDIELIKNSKTLEEADEVLTKYEEQFNILKALENKKAEEAKKKVEEMNKPKEYIYPFILHFAGRNIETDHIFEEEQSYTEEQIRVKMLEHQYYEFAGKVGFEHNKKENVLIPIFQQHKKG